VRIDPAAYDAWYRSPFGFLCHRLERDALFSLTRFHVGEKVLDAGCGIGVYLEELLRLSLDVTGVDEDGTLLEYASRSRGKGAVLVKAAIQDLPFEPGSFDKVISVCTLEYVSDPLPAFKELTRVIKNDGVLLIGFLNKNSPWAVRRMEKGKDISSVWHGVRFYGLADMDGLAQKSGLKMTGYKGAIYFPPETEDIDIPDLEAMEAEGRRRSTLTAAFMAVAFSKSR
jgi:SAM-dependent methyltransferase